MYDLLFVAIAPDGKQVRAAVKGDRDPGYGSTSKMISECAICLLRDAPDVPAGIWTPGAAMGDRLIKRLVDQRRSDVRGGDVSRLHARSPDGAIERRNAPRDGAIRDSALTPDYATGSRIGATRWLHPGYGATVFARQRCAAANMPHIAPSIIQKCRQWSVSITKLMPTVPRNAAKMAR